MDSSYKVIERTDTYEIWEAVCPADPTIRPRRIKYLAPKPEVKEEPKVEEIINEITDIASDTETESSFSEPTPARKRRK